MHRLHNRRTLHSTKERAHVTREHVKPKYGIEVSAYHSIEDGCDLHYNALFSSHVIMGVLILGGSNVCVVIYGPLLVQLVSCGDVIPSQVLAEVSSSVLGSTSLGLLSKRRHQSTMS
jgi:hypothetical protein